MHTHDLRPWQHDHAFGQDQVRAGERRTLLVVALTAAMMVVEIVAGIAYGSMALLADGLHMASHTTALGISLAAYVYARRYAADRRFSFGTGKVNSLAGFAGAVLLVAFAVAMAAESIGRLLDPVPVLFDQALIVAGIGLAVNGVSAWILAGSPHHGHGHEHAHGHGHEPADHRHEGLDHPAHDHNLRSAYLHVLADALTSLLAIGALLAGKYAGAGWLDPLMGIVGAALISRWSYGLIRDTARVLLDRQPEPLLAALRSSLEGSADRVADLHVWCIAPGRYAAEISIVTADPRPPQHYRARIPERLNIVHAVVEVHHCASHDPALSATITRPATISSGTLASERPAHGPATQ